MRNAAKNTQLMLFRALKIAAVITVVSLFSIAIGVYRSGGDFEDYFWRLMGSVDFMLFSFIVIFLLSEFYLWIVKRKTKKAKNHDKDL